VPERSRRDRVNWTWLDRTLAEVRGAPETAASTVIPPLICLATQTSFGRAMNVTIPKSLEGLVREKVVEGRYSSEDEVVADALRLMQARDAAVDIKRARLKDAIDRGYDDVAAGRVTALDNDDQIDAFFADL